MNCTWPNCECANGRAECPRMTTNELPQVVAEMREHCTHSISQGYASVSTDRVRAWADRLSTLTAQGGDAASRELYDAASKGFHISETCGPDGKYWHVSKFRSMADLHAFTDAWRAAMISVRDTTPPAPSSSAVEKWRCFHCDETFTDREAAAIHFGSHEHQRPACLIDAAEYRRMEAKEASYAEEDAAIHRQMYGMQSAHQVALRRAEEAGYAKGLRDAKALASTAASGGDDQPDAPQEGE